jgi:hypothetical protein
MDKLKNKIFIIVACFIVIIVGLVECSWELAVTRDFIQANAQEEEVQEIVEEDPTEFYPESLKDWEMPTQWWREDGYSKMEDWWNDLKTIKAETEGCAEEAIDQFGSYLSDEKEARLREIEKEIQNAHSVTACEELMTEFSNIVANAQPKPVYSSGGGSGGGGSYTGGTSNFKRDGVIYSNGWRYTWYSQNVLPGGGLRIPGRHVGEGNLIYDENGYIVVAANRSDLPYGATVETPFGTGKVYDTGCAAGTIDIYTNF